MISSTLVNLLHASVFMSTQCHQSQPSSIYIFTTSLLNPLKSDAHLPKNFKNYEKMMKNAFYFILKALFVLKIFKFLS